MGTDLGSLLQTGGDTAQQAVGNVGDLINSSGGLQGLIDKVTEAGGGDAVKSWVSTGANAPVPQGVIDGLMKNPTVAGFFEKMGVSSEQASGVINEYLPKVIDALTPDGNVPDGDGGLSNMLIDLTKGGQG
jgi:uncharacterized protein YidB (DUF937 family)